MGTATKAEPLRKLDATLIKVEYPDRWRDYSGVVIRRDDLTSDVRAAAADDWAFVVTRSPLGESDSCREHKSFVRRFL